MAGGFQGPNTEWLVLDTEAIGLVAGTPLRAMLAFDAPGGHQPPTAVPEHRMLLVTTREPVAITLRREGRRHVITARRGDVLVLPAGVRGGLDWAPHLAAIGVMIDADAIGEFARREMRTPVTGVGFAGDLVIHDPDLVSVAETMRDAIVKDGPGRDLIFDSLARVFLATLVRNHGVHATPGEEAFGPGRWSALVEHVGGNLAGHLTPARLAAVCGMSESAFRRALRQATGLSPSAWLRGERLAAALAGLRAGEALGEIAARCGFADQSHFTRSFKAVHGMTPSAWRKEAMKGPPGTRAAP